jgi:hypothetical protein
MSAAARFDVGPRAEAEGTEKLGDKAYSLEPSEDTQRFLLIIIMHKDFANNLVDVLRKINKFS